MIENKKKSDGLTMPDMSFLTAIHNKQLHIDKLIETRGQVLLVTAGLILTFALTKIIGINIYEFTLQQWGWVIISVTSGFSIILTFHTIKPQVFTKAKMPNIFYCGDFRKKLSKKEYITELTKKIGNKEKVIEAFTEEIYTLSDNVLLPSYKKLKLAYNIFILGLITGFLLTFLSALFV